MRVTPIPFNGNFDLFINYLTTVKDGVHLPHYYGNLYAYSPNDDNVYVEDLDSISLFHNEGGKTGFGGHICTYYKNIFEYLEYTYSVDFLTTTDNVDGNIWDDEFASNAYLPMRQLNPAVTTNGGVVDGLYIDYYDTGDNDNVGFLPHKDLDDKSGKTLYDCINVFFQTFNVIIDETENYIKLSRFDDLATKAEVRDWSQLADTPIKFKPFIDGYAITNTIRYSSIFTDGDVTQGQKLLTCGNENINATAELFTIDAHIPARRAVNNAASTSIDNSTVDSFKTFEVLIDGGDIEGTIKYRHGVTSNPSGVEFESKVIYKQAQLYTVASEYNLLDTLLDAPKVYEVQKWLTLADIHNLEYFKLYYIRELNGAFFINKISGFNPELSNKPYKD